MRRAYKTWVGKPERNKSLLRLQRRCKDKMKMEETA
jgi:hypothetical protein